MPLHEHEPMERHTSWRAGGAARYYAEPAMSEEARRLAAWARERGLPLVWAGRGTNTLVRDEGFAGLIAAYRAQAWQLDEAGDTALLSVEAGAPMAGLARRLGAMGWAGLAWAEGLPGTVGGAVVGNAGCYGGDVAGILHSAEILIGEMVETWPVARLRYDYRTSALKGATDTDAPPLVLAATFRLTRGDPAELAAHMAAIAAQRKSKTPAGSSCGSVFKNPPGESAGRLIEAAGLKGHAVGDAVISSAHANYIVNTGAATAADILALIEIVRAEVLRQFGVPLELEVRIL
ncbi:MAG: UDP-N-acetylmuramate dehydrogenase [Chloroflexales bacterium]|nr:UDP-N-acetylmuramate dehydrogenase [Chloroflexales bacterium]